MTSPRIRDLVTLSQIARRLGAKQTTVSSWRRRDRNFPQPCGGTEASPLFDWHDVDRWRRTGPRTKGTEGVLIDHAAYFWSALQQTEGRVRLDDGVQMAIEFLAFLQLSLDAAAGVIVRGPAAGIRLPADCRWPNAAGGVIATVRETARRLEQANDTFSCVFKVLLRHPGIDESLLDGLLTQMGRNLESEENLARVGNDIIRDYATRAVAPIGGWSIRERRANHVLMHADADANSILDLSAGDGSLLLAAGPMMRHAELIGIEDNHAANRLLMARALLGGVRVNVTHGHSGVPVNSAEVVVADVAVQPGNERRGRRRRVDPTTIRTCFRRALELTAPAGRALVVVPRNLDEASLAELRVAVAAGHAEAIVGLPNELERVGEQSNLWILGHQPDISTEVLVLDAEADPAGEASVLGEGYWAWRESAQPPAWGAVVDRSTLTDSGAPLDPGFWTNQTNRVSDDGQLQHFAEAKITTLRERTQELQTKDPYVVGVMPLSVERRTITELTYQGIVELIDGRAAHDRRRTDFVPHPEDVLIDSRGGQLFARLAGRAGERPSRGGQILRILDRELLTPAFVALCLQYGHGATVGEGGVRIQLCQIPMASLHHQRDSLEAIDRLRGHSAVVHEVLDATQDANNAVARAVAAGAASAWAP